MGSVGCITPGSKDQATAGGLLDLRAKLAAATLSDGNSSQESCYMPAGNSIWSLPAIVPQLTTCMHEELDPVLDTPFLQQGPAFSRPASFNLPATSGLSKAPSPIKTSRSTPANPSSLSFTLGAAVNGDSNVFGDSSDGSPESVEASGTPLVLAAAGAAPGYTSAQKKQVSWMDGGLKASTVDSKLDSCMQGELQAQHSAGLLPSSGLVSAASAPTLTGGDLRDQGRWSSAGRRTAGGFITNALQASSCEVLPPQEASACNTPMQPLSADCINDLLGSLGTSLFNDHSTASTPAAAAAVAAAKMRPVFPDVVDVWEGKVNTTPATDSNTAGTQDNTGVFMRRRSSTSNGGSAFAGASGAAAAASAAASTWGDEAHMFAGGMQRSSMGSFTAGFSSSAHHGLAHAHSTPAAPSPAAAAAAAQAFGQGFAQAQNPSRLQRTSSAGGPLHMSQAPGLAPTFSNGFMPADLNAAAAFGYPNPLVPFHGMHPWGPAATAAASAQSNPALAAAMLQAYSAAAAAAAAAAAVAPATMQEALAMAYLSNAFNAGSNMGMDSMGSFCLQGPPFAHSAHSMPGQAGSPLAPSDSFPPLRRHMSESSAAQAHRLGPGPRRFGPMGCSSRADPKSLSGVDPRLCVGDPSDVEAEVCRRNPGLSELLRIPPRSIKLNNVAVHRDPSPPELLASKRPAGPITPDELRIESGLLRHCFGLPSSIGPDLVRAARHTVTRDPDTPGSGLEPFFWVLQSKLAWLLKRPVFFKGQLLRGEIHSITDQQRAQSFAQVTEQRSKLGELLLVMYNMLKPNEEGQEEEGTASAWW